MIPVLRNPLQSVRRRLSYISAQPAGKAMVLFTIEGILFTLVNNMINNNNNLFALRLGANDLEISLLTTFSQIAGLVFLIPGAILTDRLSNKRKMVVLSLSLLAVSYLLISFVPAFGANRFYAFLILMSISVCPLTIYNTSWQAYFSDVIAIEHRNRVLSTRTAGTFLAGIIVSLVCGGLLASAAETEAKIRVHQSFFWTACVLLILQVFVLARISSETGRARKALGFREIGKSAAALFANKRFLGFFGVALFFYVTWQMDWTLYFIGQVRYIGLDEAWISYVGIGGTLVQFLSVGFWGKVNEKMGVRFGIILGSVGLACCPLAMLTATSVPASVGPALFLVLNTICNITYATVPLNILQCLLQVIPEENKTLNISIYTVFTSLSNAFMPMLGVKLYTALGADLHALRQTFWIVFFLRLIAIGLWTLRWLLLRKDSTQGHV